MPDGIQLPSLAIELIETTYFKGEKTKKVRPNKVPESDLVAPSKYDVKVASREEVK